MWMVLAALLGAWWALPAAADASAVARRAAVDVTDRRSQTVALPQGKTLSIEVTIGNVRVEGSERPDADILIERHAPTTSQLSRVPLSIDDTAASVIIRATQADGATDAALRTDVTVRLPRAAAIDRLRVVEGRIAIEGVTGRVSADIRRGPIEGRNLAGTVRLEAEIGSVTLTGTRLSGDGLLRLRAFNGDVRLALAERPANARVMALALNGTIKSDIPLTMREAWGPRWGETTLGKGEPVISLDVVTGTIEIKVP